MMFKPLISSVQMMRLKAKRSTYLKRTRNVVWESPTREYIAELELALKNACEEYVRRQVRTANAAPAPIDEESKKESA